MGGWRTWALGPGLGLGPAVAHAVVEVPTELPSVSLDAHPGGRAGWLVRGERKRHPRDLHPLMGEQGVWVSFKGNPVSSVCVSGGVLSSLGSWGTGPKIGEGRAVRALGWDPWSVRLSGRNLRS